MAPIVRMLETKKPRNRAAFGFLRGARFSGSLHLVFLELGVELAGIPAVDDQLL